MLVRWCEGNGTSQPHLLARLTGREVMSVKLAPVSHTPGYSAVHHPRGKKLWPLPDLRVKNAVLNALDAGESRIPLAT